MMRERARVLSSAKTGTKTEHIWITRVGGKQDSSVPRYRYRLHIYARGGWCSVREAVRVVRACSSIQSGRSREGGPRIRAPGSVCIRVCLLQYERSTREGGGVTAGGGAIRLSRCSWSARRSPPPSWPSSSLRTPPPSSPAADPTHSGTRSLRSAQPRGSCPLCPPSRRPP